MPTGSLFRKYAVPLLHTVVIAVKDKSITIQWVHEGRRSKPKSLPRAVCVNEKQIKVNDKNVRVGAHFYKDQKHVLIPQWPEYVTITGVTVIQTSPKAVRIQWKLCEGEWTDAWVPRDACLRGDRIHQFDDEIEMDRSFLNKYAVRFLNLVNTQGDTP